MEGEDLIPTFQMYFTISYKQACKQTNKQVNTQTNKQTNKQTYAHTNTHSLNITFYIQLPVLVQVSTLFLHHFFHFTTIKN
jgi:hypothetical protein